ncbi:hypothetical protein MRX96_050538 [Rhipicephalus microplus]
MASFGCAVKQRKLTRFRKTTNLPEAPETPEVVLDEEKRVREILEFEINLCRAPNLGEQANLVTVDAPVGARKFLEQEAEAKKVPEEKQVSIPPETGGLRPGPSASSDMGVDRRESVVIVYERDALGMTTPNFEIRLRNEREIRIKQHEQLAVQLFEGPPRSFFRTDTEGSYPRSPVIHHPTSSGIFCSLCCLVVTLGVLPYEVDLGLLLVMVLLLDLDSKLRSPQAPCLDLDLDLDLNIGSRAGSLVFTVSVSSRRIAIVLCGIITWSFPHFCIIYVHFGGASDPLAYNSAPLITLPEDGVGLSV